ncbi:MAG: nucleotide exchange factor GrpE [Bacteroidia bacterium]
MEATNELESLLTEQLRSINELNNRVESKENEKQDLFKELALGIIDIVDTFERVEESFIEKGLDKQEETSKIINRYKTVQKKVLNLLNKHGITKLEYPENKLIVGFSKIVDTEPDANKKNDEIITVVRNGYIRGKELIREAELIVVRN